MENLDLENACYSKAEDIERYLTIVYTDNIESWLENNRVYLNLAEELRKLIREYALIKNWDPKIAREVANDFILIAKNNAKVKALRAIREMPKPRFYQDGGN